VDLPGAGRAPGLAAPAGRRPGRTIAGPRPRPPDARRPGPGHTAYPLMAGSIRGRS